MKNVSLLPVTGKEWGVKPKQQTLVWNVRYIFYVI
jgi:hypothetical protein